MRMVLRKPSSKAFRAALAPLVQETQHARLVSRSPIPTIDEKDGLILHAVSNLLYLATICDRAKTAGMRTDALDAEEALLLEIGDTISGHLETTPLATKGGYGVTARDGKLFGLLGPVSAILADVRDRKDPLCVLDGLAVFIDGKAARTKRR
jgi:hypothetical protein